MKKGKSKRPTASTIRSNLIKKEVTLAEFARRHGYSINTVHKAMRGERNGPKSIEILDKLEEVAR